MWTWVTRRSSSEGTRVTKPCFSSPSTVADAAGGLTASSRATSAILRASWDSNERSSIIWLRFRDPGQESGSEWRVAISRARRVMESSSSSIRWSGIRAAVMRLLAFDSMLE